MLSKTRDICQVINMNYSFFFNLCNVARKYIINDAFYGTVRYPTMTRILLCYNEVILDFQNIYHTVTLFSTHVYKRAAQEMTDVNTSRVIQVVAPGDVNFALGTTNSSNDTTVVIQNAASTDPETICMSLPGFVGGLVMLLLVVVVASLVAAFLFVRVRAVDRKNAAIGGNGFVHPAYATENCSMPNPEFVKVAN